VAFFGQTSLQGKKGSCSFTCRTHRSAMTGLKFAALDDAGAESNCQ